jgi:hypothetical protein
MDAKSICNFGVNGLRRNYMEVPTRDDSSLKRRDDVQMLLPIIEGPTKPRAGAVVALRECWGRTTIPAAVE